MGEIYFFTENLNFVLRSKKLLRSWITSIAEGVGMEIGEVSYIFCDDEYLISLNKKYLDHDTYTDIITFDLGDVEKEVSGEIYISVERTRENARKFSQSAENEVHRVMAHGILHLLGYKDDTGEGKMEMKKQEDIALNKLYIRK